MFLLVIYLMIALGFSFLCSIAEAVLLSLSPSYIASLEETGPKRAARLAHLKENIDRPLAAILSLNTIAHTVGAAGVGAQATEIFGSQYVGATSAVLTLLILVFSEILPKTIGALYWRWLAPSVARLVQFLIVLMYPLVLLSEVLTRMMTRGQKTSIITREELAALAHIGAEEGHLDDSETRILRNLFRLRNLQVSDIMTPRTVIVAMPEDMTVHEVLEKHPDLPLSRIPTYKEHLDDITGFVLKTDILLAEAQGKPDAPLSEYRREIDVVPGSASISKLFDVLLNRGTHILLVIDEYGGTDGLVTLEDLMETVLGMEIVDEADETVDMQSLARAQWEKRAKRLGIELPQDEDDQPKAREEAEEAEAGAEESE